MKITVSRKDPQFPDCLVVSALHNGHGAKAVLPHRAAEGTADEIAHFLVTDVNDAIRAVACESTDEEGMALNAAGKLFLYTEAKEEKPLVILTDSEAVLLLTGEKPMPPEAAEAPKSIRPSGRSRS